MNKAPSNSNRACSHRSYFLLPLPLAVLVVVPVLVPALAPVRVHVLRLCLLKCTKLKKAGDVFVLQTTIQVMTC